MSDISKKVILNREEYPGNSKKPKNEKPKPKRIATAKRIRKPLHKRFANAFLSGEHARDVGDYILNDVVIPAAKSTIADLIEGAIDMLLFGGAGRATRGRSPYVVRDRGRSYVPYNSMHDGGTRVPGRGRNYARSGAVPERGRGRGNDVSDIIFSSRGEAESVLGELAETVDKYGAASVSDFLEMGGVSATHADQKWGWTNLEGVSVVHVREGYIVDLPRPTVID